MIIEEFDDNNNPIINPKNIGRGANHMAEGETAELWRPESKSNSRQQSGTQ
jgi:hypothetical protein